MRIRNNDYMLQLVRESYNEKNREAISTAGLKCLPKAVYFNQRIKLCGLQRQTGQTTAQSLGTKESQLPGPPQEGRANHTVVFRLAYTTYNTITCLLRQTGQTTEQSFGIVLRNNTVPITWPPEAGRTNHRLVFSVLLAIVNNTYRIVWPPEACRQERAPADNIIMEVFQQQRECFVFFCMYFIQPCFIYRP